MLQDFMEYSILYPFSTYADSVIKRHKSPNLYSLVGAGIDKHTRHSCIYKDLPKPSNMKYNFRYTFFLASCYTENGEINTV